MISEMRVMEVNNDKSLSPMHKSQRETKICGKLQVWFVAETHEPELILEDLVRFTSLSLLAGVVAVWQRKLALQSYWFA